MFDDTKSLIKIINACANSKNSDGKIESFSVFSHGHKGSIDFGLYSFNAEKLTLYIKDLVGKDGINPNAFKNPSTTFYSCNAATGGSRSFAQAWVNRVGGKTRAVVGKTEYSFINSDMCIGLEYSISRRILGGYSIPFRSLKLPSLDP